MIQMLVELTSAKILDFKKSEIKNTLPLMHQSKSSLSLLLVLFVVFIDWMGIGLVYPMFSSMLFHTKNAFLDPEATNTVRSWYLGLLLASTSLSQFFSGPILGALSDQIGRRPTFLYSLLIGAAGYFLCMLGVYWKSVAFLFIARLVVGVSTGNAAIVSATVADLSTDENKAKNFGLFSMACGLGFAVGPFLGGSFAEDGFEIPFLIAALAILLSFVLVYFFFKETHIGKHRTKIRLDEGIKNLKKALHMHGLRAIFLSNVFFCFGWSFFYEFIPVAWISDYAFTPKQIGLAYAYGAGFYALSAGVLIRPFLNRFKHSDLLFYSMVALAILMVALLVKPPAYWVWIYLPFFNFLVAMIWPTANTMVSDFSTKEAQGETLGVYQSLQAAAFGLSPLIAGPLVASSPHLPILTAGITMLVGAIIFGLMLRKKIFN